MLAVDRPSPLVVAAFVVGAALLIWLLARVVGWLVRDVLQLRFGFPAPYRPDPKLDRRQSRWTYLLTSGIGSLITNNLYASATDEGLAFEIRTLGVPFMHPVLIPWRALRRAPDGHGILIVDSTGETLVGLTPGWFEKAWLRRLESGDRTA